MDIVLIPKEYFEKVTGNRPMVCLAFGALLYFFFAKLSAAALILHPRQTPDRESLLHCADQNLYRAKQQGRNTIIG